MKQVILFADNERGVRKFLKKELESEGFCVLLTEDGSEALEVLDRFVVDAVILDEHMPRCDGRLAARRIKKRHPTLPVILFTADQDFETYAGPEVDATIIKSEDLRPLKAALARLLSVAEASLNLSRGSHHPAWIDTKVDCSG
jgi:DNA-binding response OmpR family regulator